MSFRAAGYSVGYFDFSGQASGEYRRRASDVETGRIFNYQGDPNHVKVLYDDYWESVPGGSSFSQALPGVSSINFSRVNPQAAYWSALLNHSNNGIGGLGTGLSRLGGSFRLTKGLDISFKHYPSGWGGGSRASIQTYNAVKWGGKLARGSVAYSIVAGIHNINAANIIDRRAFGYNTQVATAETIGGIGGAAIGAQIGAAVGVWFGGIRAGPGVLIGGAIGGIFGGWVGSELGHSVVQSKRKWSWISFGIVFSILFFSIGSFVYLNIRL